MSFSTKWYYLKETFTSLKRNSLMSIASVTTVALSILVLGLFLTMVLNVNNLAQYLENQVQVTVYMSDAATCVQRRQVEQQLKTTRGVMEVKGVTKEEALQNFKKRLREQEKLLDALGEDNPSLIPLKSRWINRNASRKSCPKSKRCPEWKRLNLDRKWWNISSS